MKHIEIAIVTELKDHYFPILWIKGIFFSRKKLMSKFPDIDMPPSMSVQNKWFYIGFHEISRKEFSWKKREIATVIVNTPPPTPEGSITIDGVHYMPYKRFHMELYELYNMTGELNHKANLSNAKEGGNAELVEVKEDGSHMILKFAIVGKGITTRSLHNLIDNK